MNQDSIVQIALWAHIIGGGTALLSGLGAMMAKKTRGNHVNAGRVYVYSMIVASLSGILISILKSQSFLMMIGFFSLFLVLSGWRSIFLFRNKGKGAGGWQDLVVTLVGVVFGAWLVYSGVRALVAGLTFGVVPLVLGSISCLLAYGHFRRAHSKSIKPLDWLSNHIGAMGGAYIATFTAFLVVNVSLEPGWVFWLLPTLVGTLLIRKSVNKYTGARQKT